MTITNIGASVHSLAFRKSFSISYDTSSQAPVLFVRLDTDVGISGYGCAAPDAEVSGENIQDLYAAAQHMQTAFFAKPLRTTQDIRYYHERLEKLFPYFPSLRAALEMALFDMVGKNRKLPLVKLLGEVAALKHTHAQSGRTLMTIGIEDKAQTIRDIKKYIRQGYDTIKLKCGLDVEQDIERIQAARSVLPRAVRLGIDANQGYTFAQARYLIEKLRDTDIAFFEQPTAAEDLESLARLTAMRALPIIADESAVGTEHSIALLKRNIVDGVNIKLMKCGGIFDFLAIWESAHRLGKKVMIGCMYESHLSIAAGAHIAFALPLDYVDLDSGHLDFHNDPFTGGITIKQGAFTLQKNARGIGASPHKSFYL